jgi:hypothetical protein
MEGQTEKYAAACVKNMLSHIAISEPGVISQPVLFKSDILWPVSWVMFIMLWEALKSSTSCFDRVYRDHFFAIKQPLTQSSCQSRHLAGSWNSGRTFCHL